MNSTRKKTKATTVFEQIRLDIMNGDFSAGERLQMDQLKERYGVGYSPLREALCRLSSNGLVHSEEQCGFYVAPLSLDELHDLYKIRTLIENLALELSIERGDAQWEADLVAAWHQYANYLDTKHHNKLDPEKWGVLQRNFRTALINGCKSVWLLKIRDLLHEQAGRYRNLCLSNNFNNKKYLQTFLKENEKLVQAVLARDKAKAIKLSQKTWDDSVKMIAEVLAKKLKIT